MAQCAALLEPLYGRLKRPVLKVVGTDDTPGESAGAETAAGAHRADLAVCAGAGALHTYLVKIQAELLPKSEAGQAVGYILKNWTALTRYSLDPDLAIDNNHTEQSLRGWAVGRDNSTFFGSDRGGKLQPCCAASWRPAKW